MNDSEMYCDKTVPYRGKMTLHCDKTALHRGEIIPHQGETVPHHDKTVPHREHAGMYCRLTEKQKRQSIILYTQI
jgi:hypothetical protein